jgi:hypothetical protein
VAPIPAEAFPNIAAGVLNILLAGVLLGFRFFQPAHRAFALVLITRGVVHIGQSLRLTGVIAADDLVARMVEDVMILIPFVVLYFVLVYPRRRAWLPKGPVVGVALLGLLLLIESAFLLDKAANGGASSLFGIVPVLELATLTFAVAALVFARDARGMPPGLRRQCALLVSLAFALVAWYNSVFTDSELPSGPSGFALASRLATIALLVGMALTLAGLRRDADPKLAATARRALLLLPLPVVCALAVVSLPEPVDGPWRLFFAGIWRLPLPLLVTYALLKLQFLDIEVKVKFAINRGTLAGLFVAVFFIVAQLAQNVLSDQLGLVVGGVAAGLMLFALAPLQRFAERVADVAMPGVRSPGELGSSERAAMYREWARIAWADGAMSADERRLLDAARGRLGLSHEDASRIEREAMPS